MKLLTSTAIAALATNFLLVAPASATDLSGDSNPGGYAQPYQAPKKTNWSGLYIGGRLGYGNANHELSVHDYFKDYCADEWDTEVGFPDSDKDERIEQLAADGSLTCRESGYDSVLVEGDSRKLGSLNGLNSSGITGGFQIGVDKQAGKWVFGVFGSYDLSAMDTTASAPIIGVGETVLIEKQDEWSLGARAGRLLAEDTMIYILAAYTQAEWTFGGLGPNSSDKDVTFDGVTVGGGLEHALTSNVFIGIEGTHTFYGDETILDIYDEGDNAGLQVKDELGETKVLGTLKVKFNSDLIGK